MSYRTNDRLHVVFAVAIGLFALPVGGVAALCWWQLFARAPLADALDFWVAFGLAAILTIVALGMVLVLAWVLVDVVRVRRM